MANIQTVSFDAPASGPEVYASEDEITRQRLLAKALREMAAQQQSQIASPAQGFAYLANTAVSGLLDRKAQRSADSRQQALAQALGGVMGGTPDPQSMATVMALNPELGVRLTQQQREEARQAQQDAMQRQQMELQRQQAEWQRTRPIEVGGALVDPNTYQPVYSPPAEAPNPMEVSPGATVIDPRTGRPIFQAPAAPQEPREPPNDVRLYQFDMEQRRSAGLPEIPFAAWDAERAAARREQTNVTVGPDGKMGQVPPGTVAIPDPTQPSGFRLVPMTGGEADREAQAAQRQQGAREQRQDTQGNVVIQDIDRALGLIDNSWFTTGLPGAVTSQIPGTAAHNLAKLLDTVKANAGFDQLQAMRNASPTGGALGAVTERELQFLQAVIGSLEQSQSADQLRQNLQRVRDAYTTIIDGPQAAAPPPAQQQQAPAAQQPAQPPQETPQRGSLAPGAVVDGYRFKGGNPNDPNAWEPVQ